MPESRSYSVIVPTRDRTAMLLRALQTVAEQTLLPLEVIIVDNSSQPQSFACPALSDKGVGLTLIVAPQAANAAVARNLGLFAAQSRVVAFLDDDDLWCPEKMRRQMEYLAQHPECPAVVCGRTVVGGTRSFVEHPESAVLSALLPYDNFGGSFSFIAFDRDRAPGLRLNERLSAFQDWDFLLQASRFGPLGAVPEALAVYSDHDQPRITRTLTGRRRALRILHLRHRAYIGRDARRWMVARAWDLKAQELLSIGNSAGVRHSVWRSLQWGWACRFPRKLKFRSLGRRVSLVLPRLFADTLKFLAKRRKAAPSAVGTIDFAA